MIGKFFKLFAGHSHRKLLKKYAPIVAEINKKEVALQGLSDLELSQKSDELKQKVADGAELDSVLPDAFALVKNAARRLCGQEVEVLRELTDMECDKEEVGNMYRIRFADGFITDAFEDELE